MFQLFFNITLNIAALLRVPISRSRKGFILWNYFLLTTRHFFKSNAKRQIFMGFELESFSFQTAYFLFSEIFVKNEYFFQTNSKAPIIFDCGSNIGVSVFYFKWLYPKSIIHAFEADPITVELLKKNIQRNRLENVFVHHVALSEKDGSVDFYTDPEHAGSLKMSMLQRGSGCAPVQVPARTLTSFFKENELIVDFLKMDIEGAEQTVVREAFSSGVLKKVRAATIEFHHHISDKNAHLADFLQILEQANFDYIISARHAPGYRTKLFQDILLVCRSMDELDN